MKTKIITVSILRPGGNDTALIEGIPEKKLRKSINDQIMKAFPAVEQVGFYTYNQSVKQARLEMAGGEFCGNATRSLAYLLLAGKTGKLNIQVSGTKKMLVAGSKKSSTAFAHMPIYKEQKRIKKVGNDTYIVPIKGITQIITSRPVRFDAALLKKSAKEILGEYNLLTSVPAAGVMFLSQANGVLRIDPVVWVRDIQTLFYETACASGTTAVGLYLAKYKSIDNKSVSILQPSGSVIRVSIKKNNMTFLEAVIDGPITQLEQKKITITI